MRVSAIAVLSTLLVLPSSLSFSQQTPSANTGRITYSVGKVSVQPSGKGDWIKASSGLALSAGDNLWADQNSEVEIRTHDTAVMVGPETSIAFDELSDSDIKLNLRLGSVIVQMAVTDETKHWEIITPNLKFTPRESGDYRLDVNGEGNETDVTAKQGHGQAIVEGVPYRVMAGQQLRFKTKDHVEVETGEIPEPDSFDIWASIHNQPEYQNEPEHHEEEVTDVAMDPAVTERASRRVWESNGDAGRWVYLDGIGPAWVPTHWSELITLPIPTVGVVLAEDPFSQERSARFSRQNVVLRGTPPPIAYSPVQQSVPMQSAQVPLPRNTTRTAPAQGYSGSDPLQSVSHNHDVPHSSQISIPNRMEPPHISPPKPPAPTADKPKK